MIKDFILTFEALCVLSLVCVITLTSLSLGVQTCSCPALQYILTDPLAWGWNSPNPAEAWQVGGMLALRFWAGQPGVLGCVPQQG